MNNTQSSEVSLVLSADYFFERINKLYKQWREVKKIKFHVIFCSNSMMKTIVKL